MMAERSEVGQKHCGTCFHWKRKPANPLDLANVQGECREGPPAAMMATNQNRQQIIVSYYPVLPPGFVACDRHKSDKKSGNHEGAGEGING